jgi:hypothetical protein
VTQSTSGSPQWDHPDLPEDLRWALRVAHGPGHWADVYEALEILDRYAEGRDADEQEAADEADEEPGPGPIRLRRPGRAVRLDGIPVDPSLPSPERPEEEDG